MTDKRKNQVAGLSGGLINGLFGGGGGMVLLPLLAGRLRIDNPSSAMVFGGLIGSTSGVAGGLASVDTSLVPYGAMVATFYTGLGCLLTPTVLVALTNMIF